MMSVRKLMLLFIVLAVSAMAQKLQERKNPPASDKSKGVNAAAEDITGMYTFLQDGEFVQITLDPDSVSGYISRKGDLESDHGVFLDQFFSEASVKGHEVTFTTKTVHGVWFEFKGRFDRGPKAKTKTEDGYYVLKGTLTEFTVDAAKKTTSRSREVEFKWMAEPE